MINMNKLIKYLMLNFLVVMTAFAENSPILYCPNKIECSITNNYYGTKECHLSYNPYKIWIEPTFSSMSIPRMEQVRVGAYYLSEASLGINSYFLGETSCKYEGSGVSFLIHINQKVLNKFEPLENNDSKWIKKNSSVFKCYSNETTLCAMKERPEVVINLDSWGIFHSPTFYVPNPDEVTGDYFKCFNRLTYDKLFQICGATSNCLIDIGERLNIESNNEIRHLGTVDLDISNQNEVKINSINTDPWIYIMYPVLKKTPIFKQINPFNTIAMLVNSE